MLPMIDIICLYKPIMTFYSNIFSALNFFFFFFTLIDVTWSCKPQNNVWI